jgi:hypothetical protein
LKPPYGGFFLPARWAKPQSGYPPFGDPRLRQPIINLALQGARALG